MLKEIVAYVNELTQIVLHPSFYSLPCFRRCDQYKSFVRESHVRQQIFVVFEDFVVKRNKILLSLVSITYFLKKINVCQDNVNVEKAEQR